MSRRRDAPFGAHLRQVREAAGLTQEELAARAGLSANGISDLERGARRRPYPHTVRALAEGHHSDPFSVLGSHDVGGTRVIRVMVPGARGVETVFLSADSDDVARLYARLGFARVATALIAEAE